MIGENRALTNVYDLREELIEYDGQSVSMLSEISTRHLGRTGFLSELTDLASDDDPGVSEGATWIIRDLLEGGQSLLSQDVERLVGGLGDITAWQAQLHVCQSMGYISVSGEAALTLECWLTALLDAPRPFLRAWAVDALCRLRPASSDTHALLKRMETDEAASVRARVRNLKAEFVTK
ncbi:hypothetical protein SAMN05421688_1097 [Poseidonocella pacifica]|uniref:HEAT repeat-containing protein n=1 Tax=Poseidonocella pacifica TaxID=871651 RepID=A0A1I0W6Y4_9RHOB|nr:hypothetical protein [Poseidonocella pacifica]SFA84529.1 hypothetical protein SAMN05421688_1097 [Poseidonocella pacifica]